MFQVVKKGSFEGFEAFFWTFQVHYTPWKTNI